MFNSPYLLHRDMLISIFGLTSSFHQLICLQILYSAAFPQNMLFPELLVNVLLFFYILGLYRIAPAMLLFFSSIKSDVLIPSQIAMACILSMRGNFCPVHQFDTVEELTCIKSTRSFWVFPWSDNWLVKFFENIFRTLSSDISFPPYDMFCG